MAVSIYYIKYLEFNDFVTLLIQGTTGIGIYWLGSRFFRLDTFDYVIETIKNWKSGC